MKYIFILGRNPDISFLELTSYFDARKTKYKIVNKNDNAVILETNEDLGNIMDELGGIVKIAEVIDNFNNLYNGEENKIRYAISNYTDGDTDKLKDKLKDYFKSIKLKATLKKSHYQKDFLNPSELKNTLEIVVVDGYIGKTIIVFNPEEHKTRDLQRPENRPLHTISIRLAKMMINLSGAKKGESILDPFCGYGIILQEGLLQGIEVVGMDIEKKCVDATEKNLKWLKEKYGISSSFRLFLGDATRLSEYINKIDYVVTEPYLGPFLKHMPNQSEASNIVRKLEPMYNRFLDEIRKLRIKKAVIVVPVFPTRDGKLFELNLDLHGFKTHSINYKTPTSKLLRKILIISY